MRTATHLFETGSCYHRADDLPRAEVLKFPSEYYLSDSDGYGELLKIHGTVDDPRTMVITQKDYDRLSESSLLIRARVLSLMCNHPVIFLGYSLSDSDINDLIQGIMQSLDPFDLNRFRGNMIHVSKDRKASKVIWKTKKHSSDGKIFETTELIVPDLKCLFDYLDKMQPVASPQEIRRYRSMISRIVLTTDPSNRRVRLINIDDSGKIPENEWAVIFGSADSIESVINGVVGYSAKEVVEDIMRGRTGKLHLSRTHFMTWISEKNNRRGYVPVFYFMKKNNSIITYFIKNIHGCSYLKSTIY